MDNSGESKLRVPGYGGLAVDYQNKPQDRFAHGINQYRQTPAITAREMAMVEAMNMITDKHDWHSDVFNDKIVAQWAAEARKRNKLIGKKAWAWCLAELRDKATEFREQHFVRTVDAGSCACKSDELVPGSVAKDLRAALSPLYADQTYDDGPVFYAVDPCLYPLVRGKTYVLEHGGSVTLSEFSEAELLPSEQAHEAESIDSVQQNLEEYDVDSSGSDDSDSDDSAAGRGPSRYLPQKETLQRLPCDVEFIGDHGTDVRITSYINNLHPPLHKSVYRDIERLVSASIPLWNACLIKSSIPSGDGKRGPGLSAGDQMQTGRIPLRIVTFGAEWTGQRPWAVMSRHPDIKAKLKAYAWAKETAKTDPRKVLTVLGRKMTAKNILSRWSWVERLPPTPADDDDDVHSGVVELSSWSGTLEEDVKWEHPQPGKALTYEDWKAGRNTDKAVVKMIAQHPGINGIYHGPTHKRYEVALEKSFRASGLQVIVEIGGIRLPDQIRRKYTAPWRLENALSEHVVATSLYAYDVENVTAKLAFRQETPMPPFVYRYETGSGPAMCAQDSPADFRFRNHEHGKEIEALAGVFGFGSMLDLDGCLYQTAPCFQQTGSVRLPQGRLLTFPNTVESRLEVEIPPGSQSATGHFRYVALFLVDPNYRICSTKNVPPQQHGWWAHAVPALLRRKGLPQETVDQIVELCRWSMSERESDYYAANMQRLRAKVDARRYEKIGTYYF